MNIGRTFETNAETPEVMQPGMGVFNDPAMFAKTAAVSGTAHGNHCLDTAIA